MVAMLDRLQNLDAIKPKKNSFALFFGENRIKIKLKHIISIENIQRQLTKKINKGKKQHKTYWERLISWKLPSLFYRRFRGDLLQVYKIVHDIYDPITTKLLLSRISDKSITRKKKHYNYKLIKKRRNKNGNKFFFTNRIVDIWNNLPGHVV